METATAAPLPIIHKRAASAPHRAALLEQLVKRLMFGILGRNILDLNRMSLNPAFAGFPTPNQAAGPSRQPQ
jgi:hypothetical protein